MSETGEAAAERANDVVGRLPSLAGVSLAELRRLGADAGAAGEAGRVALARGWEIVLPEVEVGSAREATCSNAVAFGERSEAEARAADGDSREDETEPCDV